MHSTISTWFKEKILFVRSLGTLSTATREISEGIELVLLLTMKSGRAPTLTTVCHDVGEYVAVRFTPPGVCMVEPDPWVHNDELTVWRVASVTSIQVLTKPSDIKVPFQEHLDVQLNTAGGSIPNNPL